MKTGSGLIMDERVHQIVKHGFTGHHHANHPEWYDKGQLITCARLLITHESREESGGLWDQIKTLCPENWNVEWFEDMYERPYEERLVIAGALISAEIDRRMSLKKMSFEQKK